MISKSDARTIAETEIASYPQPANDRLILADRETIERDWGWVFYYTSERWLKYGDLSSAMGGNPPIFIVRQSGTILHPGSEHDLDHYIGQFKATGEIR